MPESNFLRDYADAVIDIAATNYPPTYNIGDFFTQWCNALKDRLKPYKFEIKIAYKIGTIT